jgi:O-succinylbenzoic acid--CoA ligase
VILAVESADIEDEAKLLMMLKDHLPRFHVPKSIHYLQTFPETATGKIDRKKINEIIIPR